MLFMHLKVNAENYVCQLGWMSSEHIISCKRRQADSNLQETNDVMA